MLCSLNAFAVRSKRVQLSAGAPMPTAFSASDSKSLVMSEMLQARNMNFYNNTTSFIACNVNATSTVVAPAEEKTKATSELVFIPPAIGFAFDSLGPSKIVYCRSDSGSAITSGDLVIHVW